MAVYSVATLGSALERGKLSYYWGESVSHIIATAPLQTTAAASRDLFQNLFTDLGKQAMAMESIMRLVCGKVDKMENWMTEISFGMTELDLKLRNIAHNIEGTAANVDEDAMLVARWAVPHEDPDEVVKPATVSKKLGPNKKNVRITGMVATIIDTLTVPAEEREAAGARPSSGGGHHKKQSVTPHAGKKVHKKRHKDDKDKHADESIVEQPHSEAAANNSAPITQEPLISEPTRAESEDEAPAPAQSLQEAVDQLKPNDEAAKRVLSARDEAPDTARVDSNSDQSESESTSVVIERSDASIAEQAEQNVVVAPAAELQEDPEPHAGEAPVPESKSNALPVFVLETESEPVPVPSEADIVPPEPGVPVVAAPQEVEPVNIIEAEQQQLAPLRTVEVVDTSVPSTIEPAIPVSDCPDEARQTVEMEVQAPSPHAIDIPAVQTEPISSTAAEIQHAVLPTVPSPEALPSTGEATSEVSSSISAVPVVEAMVSPVPAKRVAKSKAPSVRKVLLAAKAVRGVRSGRPVLQREGSMPRRSPSRAQVVMSDPESSRSQTGAGAASSSSESSSNSSGDDDGNSSSGDSQASRANGGNNGTNKAASMTRTITALKKLKKANVLSAEEEQELKERAQQKWFKLKGHMKEKKKKDVANILLKRKKNVFTVSARIELLEEKSRELYASLKQVNTEIKTKLDSATHEGLRRHVHDIDHSLKVLDLRLSQLSAPAMEKVAELSAEIETLRSYIAQHMTLVDEHMEEKHQKMMQRIDEQQDQIGFLDETAQQRILQLGNEFDAKMRQLPDYSVAMDTLRRLLRKKADLKLLKELEERLLGQNNESEDCLVRCLSCHKEVTRQQEIDAQQQSDEQLDNPALRKVNPGPSAARIYRSSTPLSAQPIGKFEAIQEDYEHIVDNSYISEWSVNEPSPLPGSRTPLIKTPTRKDDKQTSVAPISLINVTANRAVLSQEHRPISAPAAALKKKSSFKARGPAGGS